MATYTSNLNLKKPAASDTVSIADINDNMDTIDSAVAALSPVLLWTNSDTSADFAAQTVSLSLSAYSMVRVEYLLKTGYVGRAVHEHVKGFMNVAFGLYPGSPFVQTTREVLVSATGVQFYAGYVTTSGGAACTANNTYMVPYRIYGIK